MKAAGNTTVGSVNNFGCECVSLKKALLPRTTTDMGLLFFFKQCRADEDEGLGGGGGLMS